MNNFKYFTTMENKITKKAVKVKEVAQEVNTVNENTLATEQENTVATEQENTPTNSKGRTIKNIPNHITELALIVKNNAQIRRYTAIAIINYLCQKGEINKISAEEQSKGKGNYVNFLWDKFTVKSNGLSRDYRYTEKFFITALIGSFTSFAANSKEVIINFLKEENADFNIE